MSFLSFVVGNSGSTLASFAACGLAVDVIRWRRTPDLRQPIKTTYKDLRNDFDDVERTSESNPQPSDALRPWEAVFYLHGIIHIAIYWTGLAKYLTPSAVMISLLNRFQTVVPVAPTLSVDQAGNLRSLLCQIDVYFLGWLIIYICLTLRTGFSSMYRTARGLYRRRVKLNEQKQILRRRYIREVMIGLCLIVLPLLLLRWLLSAAAAGNYEDMLRSSPTGLFISSSILGSALIGQPLVYVYLLINRCLATSNPDLTDEAEVGSR